MPTIYLAGKISKHDWRHDVVEGLRSAYTDDDLGCARPWPILTEAVCGVLDYVGPFFTSCDHGCAHYTGTHGTFDGICIPPMFGGHESPMDERSTVFARCLAAIRRADIFFAWIDDPTCYGTLVEIGYARNFCQTIYVAISPEWADDLWFAREMATDRPGYPSPVLAVEDIASRHRLDAKASLIESPIEAAFWQVHQELGLSELANLTPQHRVFNGRYRLDFALPDRKIGIELDGFAWHGDQDAFVRDRSRQRDLEADGWRILRFAGKEVTDDTKRCVVQAAEFVKKTAPRPVRPALEALRQGGRLGKSPC